MFLGANLLLLRPVTTQTLMCPCYCLVKFRQRPRLARQPHLLKEHASPQSGLPKQYKVLVHFFQLFLLIFEITVELHSFPLPFLS